MAAPKTQRRRYKRTPARNIFYRITYGKSTAPPVAPLRALCLLGEATPRVASRSALPHPGLLLCGASRRFGFAFLHFLHSHPISGKKRYNWFNFTLNKTVFPKRPFSIFNFTAKVAKLLLSPFLCVLCGYLCALCGYLCVLCGYLCVLCGYLCVLCVRRLRYRILFTSDYIHLHNGGYCLYIKYVVPIARTFIL